MVVYLPQLQADRCIREENGTHLGGHACHTFRFTWDQSLNSETA